MEPQACGYDPAGARIWRDQPCAVQAGPGTHAELCVLPGTVPKHRLPRGVLHGAVGAVQEGAGDPRHAQDGQEGAAGCRRMRGHCTASVHDRRGTPAGPPAARDQPELPGVEPHVCAPGAAHAVHQDAADGCCAHHAGRGVCRGAPARAGGASEPGVWRQGRSHRGVRGRTKDRAAVRGHLRAVLRLPCPRLGDQGRHFPPRARAPGLPARHLHGQLLRLAVPGGLRAAAASGDDRAVRHVPARAAPVPGGGRALLPWAGARMRLQLRGRAGPACGLRAAQPGLQRGHAAAAEVGGHGDDHDRGVVPGASHYPRLHPATTLPRASRHERQLCGRGHRAAGGLAGVQLPRVCQAAGAQVRRQPPRAGLGGPAHPMTSLVTAVAAARCSSLPHERDDGGLAQWLAGLGACVAVGWHRVNVRWPVRAARLPGSREGRI
mmetsp:Transcript_20497/g.51947  ORF Transcript_20497/g.51947 Transcript_20497/m.51947 type:complete len:435 (-) Transcript_20497:598-1902(-)